MKVRMFLGSAALVMLLVLAGCARAPGTTCLAPYMTKGDACCLDKNENNICDEDEATKVTAVVKDRPILVYEEVCDATSRFECTDRKVTRDYVWLKLRFVKDELLSVKSIEFPDFRCKQTFDLPQMKYNDVQEFKVPCVLDKDIVRSKIVIHAEVQNYLRYSNGQAYEITEPREFSLAGTLSGAVQP